MFNKLKRYGLITENRIGRKERQLLKVNEKIRLEQERIDSFLKEINSQQLHFQTLKLSGRTNLSGIHELRSLQASVKRSMANNEMSLELSKIEQNKMKAQQEELNQTRKALLRKTEKITFHKKRLKQISLQKQENNQEIEAAELSGWQKY